MFGMVYSESPTLRQSACACYGVCRSTNNLISFLSLLSFTESTFKLLKFVRENFWNIDKENTVGLQTDGNSSKPFPCVIYIRWSILKFFCDYLSRTFSTKVNISSLSC